jgi:hypothetical protein
MNKIRISTISLLLGLAGAFTAAAWGAESVMSLISTGEAVQSEVQSSKSSLDDLLKQQKEEAATGKNLQAEQQQLNQAIQDFQKEKDGVNQQNTDYKAKCLGKQLNNDDYKACKAMSDSINAAIVKINNEAATLQKRANDSKGRVDTFNTVIKTLPQSITAANTNYKNAFNKEQSWLYNARTLVASQDFQPYAKKAGCPDAQKTPKNEDQVLKMSSDILACLKRVSGGN